MNIKVDISYLPGIYEKYLELYESGVPVNELNFKQVSGPSKSTAEAFIMLYEAIKANGFREAGECNYRNDVPKKYGRVTAITGSVNSHGGIIIDGGHHRLSILKFLKYKDVTVSLHDTHPAFEEFYAYMLDFQGGSKQMYQPLNYWACSTWPYARGFNRTELILSRLAPKSTILDLGCHIGGVSHLLSMEGHKVTGIEKRKNSIYCANYLADYYSWCNEPRELLQHNSLPKFPNYCKPSYLVGDVKNAIAKVGKVDYTLFLSLYRWVNNKEEILRKIGEITNKSVFVDVEVHLESELKQKILDVTKFTHVSKLGVEDVGPKMGRSYNKPRILYEVS